MQKKVTSSTNVDYGITDPSVKFDLAQAAFKLSDKQATGLVEYVGFVATRLPQVITQKVPGMQVRQIKVKDYGFVGGAQCELGHRVRYLWTVESGSDDPTTARRHAFGVTCAEASLGLTPAEITLVKGLDRWTRDTAKRELLRVLGEGVKGGKDGQAVWAQYMVGPNYKAVVDALAIVKGREENAVRDLPPAELSSRTDRRRLQALGRICTAVSTAEYLIAHELPVPYKFKQWLVRAAERIRSGVRRGGTRASVTTSTLSTAGVQLPAPQSGTLSGAGTRTQAGTSPATVNGMGSAAQASSMQGSLFNN